MGLSKNMEEESAWMNAEYWFQSMLISSGERHAHTAAKKNMSVFREQTKQAVKYIASVNLYGCI